MKIDEITYEIRGAIFEGNHVLGHGFLEKVYENALMIELHNRGLAAANQVPLKVKYKDKVVGDFFTDILVEGKVVVEVKAIEGIRKEQEAQLLNYLRATGITVGLLVNLDSRKRRSKEWS